MVFIETTTLIFLHAQTHQHVLNSLKIPATSHSTHHGSQHLPIESHVYLKRAGEIWNILKHSETLLVPNFIYFETFIEDNLATYTKTSNHSFKGSDRSGFLSRGHHFSEAFFANARLPIHQNSEINTAIVVSWAAEGNAIDSSRLFQLMRI